MTILDFFIICICVSMCITTIHVSLWEGMALQYIRRKMDKLLTVDTNKLHWVAKPLYDCIICMCSIWGTIAFFILQFYFNIAVELLPALILVVGGINTIISGAIFLAFEKHNL